MPEIIVCIKQSLDVSQLKIHPETRGIIIEGTPRKVSDFDKNALEEAIRLREKHGGRVIAVTMGPPQVREALREALAMGADGAYMICDQGLEGSDTLVTAIALAAAIKRIGRFDLIVCGEASVDGYSAQVGPRLAELLDIPQITYVRRVSLEGDTVIVERDLEDCYEVVAAKVPVLMTVTKEINEPRLPTLSAILRASRKEIVAWNLAELGLPAERVGETGSGVRVVRVVAPEARKGAVLIKAGTAGEAAEELAKILVKEHLLGG